MKYAITVWLLMSSISVSAASLTPSKEAKIAASCAWAAEEIFDIAVEKLNPNSKEKDLSVYLRQNMTVTEYQVMSRRLLMLEKYVEAELKPGATAISIAEKSFYSCIAESYTSRGYQPTKRLNLYMRRFEALIAKLKKENTGI